MTAAVARGRRRAAPTPLEFSIHVTIADLLTYTAAPGWIWFHVPNGEYRFKATAGRLKAMGVKGGISDFLLVSPNGAQLHALELKRLGKRPTKTQEDFMAAVRDAGGKADWADNVAYAVKILEDWGALRRMQWN